jgi:hypothetical protein
MKSRLLPLLIFVLFPAFGYSQPGLGGSPPSFGFKNLNNTIDTREVPKPDLSLVSYADSMNDLYGNPFRIGLNIPVFLNMKNSGTWTELPDHSGRIWRLNITSPDAKALTLYYSAFYLPEGSRFFLYNENKKQVLGAYTHMVNPESGSFATEMVQGGNVTMEYFEPAGLTGEGVINIEEICYIYRGEMQLNPDMEQYKSSGICEVDVNCSPEGSNWQDEKKGICKIQIKNGSSTILCSGSLVNNKRQECIPYVLTADHCAYYSGYSTEQDQWVFYFHYESPTCGGSTSGSYITKTGCTLKAHDTYGSNHSGSDFYLVRLNQSILTSDSLYYNGWSRSTSASASGASLHHPGGDIMKISTYTSSLTSADIGFTGSHWQVIWSGTTHGNGITEPGSSGSPIFNSSGLIVGTLTGGNSCCLVDSCGSNTGPTEPDYFGKFLYHWAANGSTATKQLKPWLDPDNNNPTSLNGTYTCSPSGVEESYVLSTSMDIFPNPASHELHVTFGDRAVIDPTLKIYSLLGQELWNRSFSGEIKEELVIDVHLLSSGLYFLSVQAGNILVAKKFIIQQ